MCELLDLELAALEQLQLGVQSGFLLERGVAEKVPHAEAADERVLGADARVGLGARSLVFELIELPLSLVLDLEPLVPCETQFLLALGLRELEPELQDLLVGLG